MVVCEGGFLTRRQLYSQISHILKTLCQHHDMLISNDYTSRASVYYEPIATNYDNDIPVVTPATPRYFYGNSVIGSALMHNTRSHLSQRNTLTKR